MNPGGIVLIIAGVWVGCQLFGGQALQRLGVVPVTNSNGDQVVVGTATPAAATTPPTGATVRNA